MVSPVSPVSQVYGVAGVANIYRRAQEQKVQSRGENSQRISTGANIKTAAETVSSERSTANSSSDGRIAGRTDAAGDKALAEAKFNEAQSNEVKIRTDKQLGIQECTTCSTRQYVDGSNDPGVSFKSPGHISPEASKAVVSAHEQEHVTNEQARASAEDKKVVSQNVQLHMDKCPECGKSYVSGGTTTTVTQSAPKRSESELPVENSQKSKLDRTYNALANVFKNRAGQLLDIAV